MIDITTTATAASVLDSLAPDKGNSSYLQYTGSGFLDILKNNMENTDYRPEEFSRESDAGYNYGNPGNYNEDISYNNIDENRYGSDVVNSSYQTENSRENFNRDNSINNKSDEKNERINDSEHKNQSLGNEVKPEESDSSDEVIDDKLLLELESSADIKDDFIEIKILKQILSELENKLKNNDNSDSTPLIEGIANLIDVIGSLTKEKGAITDLKKSLSRLDSQLKNIGNENNKKNLNSTINEIKGLLDKIKPDNLNLKTDIREIITRVNDLLLKAGGISARDRNQHIRISPDNGATDQKGSNTGNTLLSMNDAGESETDRQPGSNDNSGNDSSFNFSNFKSRMQGSENILENRTAKRSAFKQQLQSIIENSKVIVKDSRNGSFAVKLYPKELGSVNINIGLEQGVVTGKFLVDNAEAKNLLMQNLDYIKEQLEEAGIEVGEFHVNVNDQRELYRDNEEENFISSSVDEDISETGNVYDINSMAVHEGSLNIVI